MLLSEACRAEATEEMTTGIARVSILMSCHLAPHKRSGIAPTAHEERPVNFLRLYVSLTVATCPPAVALEIVAERESTFK